MNEYGDHFAIVGAKIVDVVNGGTPTMNVFIEGGRISKIFPDSGKDITDDAIVIDGRGKYLIPGLWDMHAHLTIWPEFTGSIANLLVATGVTSVRDMGGQLEDVLTLRKKLLRLDTLGPRLWIAGPIIDGSPRIMEEDPQLGLTDISISVDTPTEALQTVDYLREQGVDFIKAYEMLRPDVFTALVQRAQVYELPAAGHLPIRMTIPEVLEVGQYDIQHLGGVCSGMKYECGPNPADLLARQISVLDESAPEHGASDAIGGRGISLAMKVLKAVSIDPSSQDSKRRRELIKIFVEKNTWHTPTLVNKVGFRALGFEHDPAWLNTFNYLPPSRQAQSKKLRENKDDTLDTEAWSQWSLETVGEMHEAGVKILAGTDCPPTPFLYAGICSSLRAASYGSCWNVAAGCLANSDCKSSRIFQY